MENSFEEANAVMIEAQESYKNKDTWNIFKNNHKFISSQYENLKKENKNQNEINIEIFKAWFDDKEYQKDSKEGGKGYIERYVKAYTKFRNNEKSEIYFDYYESGNKKDYPKLAPKKLNDILYATTNGKITIDDINEKNLSKKITLSQKD